MDLFTDDAYDRTKLMHKTELDNVAIEIVSLHQRRNGRQGAAATMGGGKDPCHGQPPPRMHLPLQSILTGSNHAAGALIEVNGTGQGLT
jgi:hypothetical protein